MGAYGELELEQKFVGGQTRAVLSAAKLSANLAEFARPISEHKRAAGVLMQREIVRIRSAENIAVHGEPVADPLGTIEAAAHEPAARELVVTRDIEAERSRKSVSGNAQAAPDDLAAAYEGMVDGTAQGLPADGGIHAIELIDCIRAEYRMAARVGTSNIEVGGFADIPIGAQMSDARHVVAVVSLEQIEGIAAEDLRRAFQEDLAGALKNPAHCQSSVVDAILATDQVLRYQRPVGPGQYVIVQGIDLAEGSAHFADTQLQVRRQGGER